MSVYAVAEHAGVRGISALIDRHSAHTSDPIGQALSGAERVCGVLILRESLIINGASDRT